MSENTDKQPVCYARANGKSCMQAYYSLLEMICKELARVVLDYPNKRVVWLMRHGKNRRIRKKNYTRIINHYIKNNKEKVNEKNSIRR